MKKIIRRLTAGVLALLLTFAMTVPAYADEPSGDAWSWSTIEKIAAASPQDNYKALTKGGSDAVYYVPYTNKGVLPFPSALAEAMQVSLQNLLEPGTPEIAMTAVTNLEEGSQKGTARLTFANGETSSQSPSGIYKVMAQLPGKSQKSAYGYVLLNPKTPETAQGVHVRVYDDAVSSAVRPVYQSKTIDVPYSARESRAPFSGDLITYPTAVDALLAARQQNDGLTAVNTYPYQQEHQDAIVADLQIGDKNYIETAQETGNKWRFAVYDRNGNRKQSLIPGVADLYPIQDGDTVIWALTARDFPTTLPSVPDQEKPQEPGALPGNVLDIQRWTGSNRQEVAANVAKSFFADANTAILVNNVAFADAISATNISQGEAPILYTQANRLLPETRKILQTIHPKQVYIMGGKASVNASVEASVRSLLKGTKVIRIDGRDRYEVNAKAAAQNFPSGVTKAVVTTGIVYSDALTATPLAQIQKAPVLLVSPTAVSSYTKAYLRQQPAMKLTILGGNRSVNRTVQKQLESLTQNSAQRFNGANRYEVAAKVASSYFPTAKVGMVASGEVFSDALVAAPLSQKLNAPILLVQKANLGQSIEAYLKSNKAISLLHVLGGENTVASSVLTKLGEFGRPSNTTMPIVR